jgi:glycerol-3-phosphate dehydrogenase
LVRRTRLAFVDSEGSFESLPEVVKIFAKELNWDKERYERELK